MAAHLRKKSHATSPIFTAFPCSLFRRLPTRDDELMDADTMIQVRKNLKEKAKSLWAIFDYYQKIIRSSDFETGAHAAALSCSQAVKPAVEALQQQINNDLYLQHLKNSSGKTFDMQWRAGIMAVDKIPEYFAKTYILQPFVSSVLHEKLRLLTDPAKAELFFYCPLPKDIETLVDSCYKKDWEKSME